LLNDLLRTQTHANKEELPHGPVVAKTIIIARTRQASLPPLPLDESEDFEREQQYHHVQSSVFVVSVFNSGDRKSARRRRWW
jgi:hypothetical protein